MSNSEDYNSEPITWRIDRTPDYTINNQWLPDPFYPDEHLTPITNFEFRERYFNQYNNLSNNFENINNQIITTIHNTSNTILRNRNLYINDNDDFIPFNYIPPQQIPETSTIVVTVQEFLVSDEDRNCCICMEQRECQEICRLNCQHLFCVQCINTNLSRNNSCPLCREPILNIQTQNNNARSQINL